MLQETKSILYVLKIICDHFYPMVILTDWDISSAQWFTLFMMAL